MGAIDPTPRNWYSWSANGTYTRLAGKHTLKVGGDYRLIGIETQSFSGSAGDFDFDRFFTSSNPLANGTGGTAPRATRSPRCCSATPPVTWQPEPHRRLAGRFDAFVHYFGGYAQDDWRLSPKTTVNLGLRLEHETGLTEKNDGFTVAFDRDAEPRRRARQRRQPVTGQPIRGGLVYAGVERRQHIPGRPAGDEVLAARRASSTRSTRRRCCAPATASTGRRGTTRASVRQLRPDRLQPARPSSARASSGRPSSLTTRSRTACCSRRQPARRAGRRRRPDRVHRSGQEGALRPAVLD